MPHLLIDLEQQILELWQGEALDQVYAISSALKGPGEVRDSEQTPRGLHVIRAKIGGGCPINTVFVGRRPTGEVYSPFLAEQYPARDWILSRILWLSGCEVGKNRLGWVDTMQRYIYIHGCPEGSPMGVAGSHGCIRMRNVDIMALFDRVSVGTPVKIGVKGCCQAS